MRILALVQNERLAEYILHTILVVENIEVCALYIHHNDFFVKA